MHSPKHFLLCTDLHPTSVNGKENTYIIPSPLSFLPLISTPLHSIFRLPLHSFPFTDHRSSSEALTRHFTEQLSVFKKVCVVNTLNQSGQERKLSDAYEDHLLSFNSADMKYVVFDFHHIW